MEFIERGNVYCSATAFVLWHVEGETLFIYLAAGDIREFFTIPHEQPKWISFMRRGDSRRYAYQSLKSKFHGRTKAPKTDPSPATGARIESTGRP